MPSVLIFPVRSETLPPATHTNCYLVGERWLVDPGSPFDEENEALVAKLHGFDIAGIVLTHRHRDHVSGANFLSHALGKKIFAHPITANEVKEKIKVDSLLNDGDRLPLAGGAAAEVLHTPGHARGHICLWQPEEGWLVCGDMVAGLGSILIAPPDGNVAEYLQQLGRLRALAPKILFPAHGPAIEDAQAKLDTYIAHRHKREQQVLAALSDAWQTPAEIVRVAYADTPMAMHGVAALAALAHLQKLVDDGLAQLRDDRFARL